MITFIDYGFITPDYLTDHHNRENEFLCGIGDTHSNEDLAEAIFDELFYAAHRDSFKDLLLQDILKAIEGSTICPEQFDGEYTDDMYYNLPTRYIAVIIQ